MNVDEISDNVVIFPNKVRLQEVNSIVLEGDEKLQELKYILLGLLFLLQTFWVGPRSSQVTFKFVY